MAGVASRSTGIAQERRRRKKFRAGLGKLLGPIGGVLEGTAKTLSSISNVIDNTLEDFAVAAVDDVVIETGVALVHISDNLGNLAAALGNGDLGDSAAAAAQLYFELHKDVIDGALALAETAVLVSLKNLEEAALDISEAIAGVVSGDPFLSVGYETLLASFVAIGNFIAGAFTSGY